MFIAVRVSPFSFWQPHAPGPKMPPFIETILSSDIGRMTLALLISLPIALDRERATHIVGLRTFPLVALASCGVVIIGMTLIGPTDDGAQARIIQGVMAGIGFIGGGAILKGDGQVTGTASAASIWATGVIGIATAYGRFDIALFLAAANFFILKVFTRFKTRLHKNEEA
jgi:putative Mg2+ transporter-C (MgtC) family protein